MKIHAIQYEYPAPPIVARFASAADRDAYIAARPGCRRPIAPVQARGFHRGSTGTGIEYEFRLATVDDLAPPVTALRDAVIEKLKEAAVSP